MCFVFGIVLFLWEELGLGYFIFGLFCICKYLYSIKVMMVVVYSVFKGSVLVWVCLCWFLGGGCCWDFVVLRLLWVGFFVEEGRGWLVELGFGICRWF